MWKYQKKNKDMKRKQTREHQDAAHRLQSSSEWSKECLWESACKTWIARVPNTTGQRDHDDYDDHDDQDDHDDNDDHDGHDDQDDQDVFESLPVKPE